MNRQLLRAALVALVILEVPVLILLAVALVEWVQTGGP